MSGILGFVALILAPPLLGLVLGLLQLAVYRVLVGLGRLPRERIPFFPFLWLRGMIAVVAVGAVLAIIQTIANGGPP
jgi:hypothetical protein